LPIYFVKFNKRTSYLSSDFNLADWFNIIFMQTPKINESKKVKHGSASPFSLLMIMDYSTVLTF